MLRRVLCGLVLMGGFVQSCFALEDPQDIKFQVDVVSPRQLLVEPDQRVVADCLVAFYEGGIVRTEMIVQGNIEIGYTILQEPVVNPYTGKNVPGELKYVDVAAKDYSFRIPARLYIVGVPVLGFQDSFSIPFQGFRWTRGLQYQVSPKVTSIAPVNGIYTLPVIKCIPGVTGEFACPSFADPGQGAPNFDRN